MRLGFGQIETALREMHGVDPSKERSFRARLRYLQQRVDIGIPRAGAGRRANFTFGHALLFAIALELEQFGMSPERVALTLDALGFDKGRASLHRAVAEAASRMGSKRPAVLVWFYPDALSEATRADGDKADLAESTITWTEHDDLPSDLFTADGMLTRLAIVNLSAVVSGLVEQLGGDPAAMQAALLEWANEGESNGDHPQARLDHGEG